MSSIQQTNQNRKLFTSNYAANTVDRIYNPTFPRSNYKSLFLRLVNGTVTKTESAPGVLSENPLSIVRAVRIKAEGDVIKEFEPSLLRVFSHHICRRSDTNLGVLTLGTDVAEAGVNGRLAMDFASIGTRYPEASYFPGDRYADLSMEVEWGSPTDLVAGGTYSVGPSFATPPQLEVWGEEIIDPAIKKRDFLILKNQVKTWGISSVAENGRSFPLPVGETYRGILLKQLTRSPDLPIATLLTAASNIVVKVQTDTGSFRRIETTWGELIQRNQAQYGIALPVGYAYLDFMEGGDFAGALKTGDAVKVSSVELTADVASVANAFLQMLLVTYKGAK